MNNKFFAISSFIRLDIFNHFMVKFNKVAVIDLVKLSSWYNDGKVTDHAGEKKKYLFEMLNSCCKII